MTDVITIDDDIFEELKMAPGNFTGKVIDISGASPHYASHLNVTLASHFNVTLEQMAIEVIEDSIRKAAVKFGIEVVAFWKDETDIDDNDLRLIMNQRITLLK